jgi:predicted aldo/keto reductase-like oxidoreductase
MRIDSSRRRFLAGGLGLPVAGAAMTARPLPFVPGQPAGAPAAGLSYRTLGKTGLKVTSVGFGCMVTSDASVVERAAEMGINYFDTARSYSNGNNERMVGAALKGRRQDLIIATKTRGATGAELLAQLDTSLKELGFDYVDIWNVHGVSQAEAMTDDVLEAQRKAKESGKARFVGVSTHSGMTELIPALVKGGQIDVILTSYNFTMDDQMTKVVNEARQAGVGIVAMKVMAGGAGRLKPGERGYEALQQPGGLLAALKWALANPNVDTTVPSITDMDQLEENIRAMTEPLTANDKQMLAARLEQIRPLYCRMCGSCEGKCPQGLPVADVLRYLMYAEGYGQFALGIENYRALPSGLAKARCSECGGCAVECPNGVAVAARMSRAQELFG